LIRVFVLILSKGLLIRRSIPDLGSFSNTARCRMEEAKIN
jgi:hypothetical protein